LDFTSHKTGLITQGSNGCLLREPNETYITLVKYKFNDVQIHGTRGHGRAAKSLWTIGPNALRSTVMK
jgi:hypothetical protein